MGEVEKEKAKGRGRGERRVGVPTTDKRGGLTEREIEFTLIRANN